eukprot:TRINITY_DN2148_c1_g2_i1.p1 TRINITY_DN2148_c1_g2~~TRINITY_DN2148_c1_g2_i1.p1  ORF type:complete len:630 (+),score=67.45 TRINITY_DN2148_c1_g2_i1:185-2074(+)
MRKILLPLLVASLMNFCSAYYLTVSLQTWNPDEGSLSPFVNSLTSVDAIIPFEFYDLKYCQPKEKNELKGLGLGMMLRGDHVEQSLYEFEILVNSTCKKVGCSEGEDTLSSEDVKKFDRYIHGGYRANMILDNLPMIATEEARYKATKNFCVNDRNPQRSTPEVRGAAIGGCEGDRAFINNHFSFIIHYNKLKGKGIFVVGFEVIPSSHNSDSCIADADRVYIKTLEGGGKVPWTYSVTWIEKPDAQWVTRWDYYLSTSEADTDARSHWIKITQSLIVMLCLSALVVVIISRTLHLDFNRYNSPDNDEELQEEVGWKLVHADVFRPPSHPHLFAGVIGTGVQLIGMTLTVLGAAILGFLSPAFRGASITSGIFLFVLMAFFNGYVTGLMQMMFGIRSWRSAVLSGVVFPGFVFTVWVFCECMLAWRGAATAVPLSTILFIIVLWFGVCIPLIILGASFGFRRKPIENPLKYNTLARAIPPQRFLLSPACLMIPGLIPYTASHLELKLILRAIWQGQVYYVFGFLTMVALVVMVSVCLTTIVYVYYQLVFENHRWWWRSMGITAGMSLYYFIYCMYYYSNVLKVRSWTGMVVYFSFTTVSAISIGIIVGTIGFFAAWLFIRKIYSSIKIE